MAELSVDPQQIHKAVSRLEGIATEIERTVGEHRSALDTAPAGRDEVSVTAAKSFSETAELFDQEIVKGVKAIRDVASALRDGTAAVSATDDAMAENLSGI
ncbi:WXG100 family type VII secretion target [Williamsia sp. M5A3_1d]